MPTGQNWVREAARDWTKYTGGYVNHGYVGKHLKELVDGEGWENVRPEWIRYLQETEPRFLSAPYFARSVWPQRAGNGRISQERAREMFRAAGLEPPHIMQDYYNGTVAVQRMIDRELAKRKAS